MKNLDECEKNLEEYLKKNPHMREEQEKLTKILSRCPDIESRIRLLMGMLHEKVDELERIIESAK